MLPLIRPAISFYCIVGGRKSLSQRQTGVQRNECLELGVLHTENQSVRWYRVWEVFIVAFRLGLTSFGGPIAHIGYFHQTYVAKKKWISETDFSDLLALSQFLPGPSSSQMGIAIGLTRAGVLGSIAAWFGFTMPSAILMTLFGLWFGNTNVHQTGWLHGLMIVAVAVVAQAIWSMARQFAANRLTASFAVVAAAISLLWPSAWTQVAVIAVAGTIGAVFLERTATPKDTETAMPIRRSTGALCLALALALFIILPVVAVVHPNQWIALVSTMYRTGALVFGGGHVMLPLLQQPVMQYGWLTNGQFLAGYGAAQAIPGPLSTFAAYIGAVKQFAPNGWLGAAIALVSIFLPAFLLVLGALPYWRMLRKRARVRAGLSGVNAAVVGILVAAWYHPVWTSAIQTSADFAVALLAFGLMTAWKLPTWIVVLVVALTTGLWPGFR